MSYLNYLEDRLSVLKNRKNKVEEGTLANRIFTSQAIEVAEAKRKYIESKERAKTDIWLDGFSEREQKHIMFAINYVKEYGHGTDGHLSLCIIAKLAILLTEEQEKVIG